MHAFTLVTDKQSHPVLLVVVADHGLFYLPSDPLYPPTFLPFGDFESIEKQVADSGQVTKQYAVVLHAQSSGPSYLFYTHDKALRDHVAAQIAPHIRPRSLKFDLLYQNRLLRKQLRAAALSTQQLPSEFRKVLAKCSVLETLLEATELQLVDALAACENNSVKTHNEPHWLSGTENNPLKATPQTIDSAEEDSPARLRGDEVKDRGKTTSEGDNEITITTPRLNCTSLHLKADESPIGTGLLCAPSSCFTRPTAQSFTRIVPIQIPSSKTSKLGQFTQNDKTDKLSLLRWKRELLLEELGITKLSDK